MKLFIMAFGIFVLIVGIMLILVPKTAKERFTKLLTIKDYRFIGFLSIFMGILFLFASRKSSMSVFVVLVGLASIAKGLFFAFASHDKAKFFINWWLSMSDDRYRIWGIVSLIMGMLLVVAGM